MKKLTIVDLIELGYTNPNDYMTDEELATAKQKGYITEEQESEFKVKKQKNKEKPKKEK